jgi:hypothetical protein
MRVGGPYKRPGRGSAFPQCPQNIKSPSYESCPGYPGMSGLRLVGILHSTGMACGGLVASAQAATGAEQYKKFCLRLQRDRDRFLVSKRLPWLATHETLEKNRKNPSRGSWGLFPSLAGRWVSTCRPFRRRGRLPEPQPWARAAQPPVLRWSAEGRRSMPRSARLYGSPWLGRLHRP